MPGEIGLDHFGNQFFERRLCRPTEFNLCLGSVAVQHVDFRGT
jgi:hypothetical protein